jgi:hypothetical protein
LVEHADDFLMSQSAVSTAAIAVIMTGRRASTLLVEMLRLDAARRGR